MILIAFQDFFVVHSTEVFFVYGLAFFLMGFAIALQSKSSSDIPLAKSLKYLALFGFFHGFVEWGMMFLRLQRELVAINNYENFIVFKTLLNSLSFMFLFIFGTKLLTETKRRWRSMNYIPIVLFSFWLVIYVLSSFFYYDDFRLWINASNTWSRYLLAFPGSIVAAYAIYLQIPILNEKRFHTPPSLLKKFSLVFLGYALAGGLIVPEANFFPASIVNIDSFFAITGIPIYLFRAICGIFMAYYAVHILRIFKQDFQQQLAQAQVLNSIYNERERFSRDLHDGVIQSIYGVGLYLENATISIDQEPEKAKSHIQVVTVKLNDIISQMRNYIGDLHGHSNKNGETLLASLYEIVHDFKDHSGIAVSFDHEQITNTHNISEEVSKNIELIAFELLTNVIKHASATIVKIELKDTNNVLSLVISDNGKGFNKKSCQRLQSKGERQGLKNIQQRARMLGGTLLVNSKIGKGTTVDIQIPREV